MNRIRSITATTALIATLALAGAPAATAEPAASTAPIYLAAFGEKQAKGLLVIGAFVVACVVVLAAIGSIAGASDEKKTSERKQVADSHLDRGRKVVEDWWAAQMAAARATIPVPDPRAYDPDGIGLAPPRMPEPVMPERPPMSDADLIRYADFGAMIPWTPGTAFASVVSRNGSLNPARTAWFEATRAARFGDFDEEDTFTPAATLARVEQPQNGEDVALIVEPRDIFVTEQALNKTLPFLVKTARVLSASPFIRDHGTGNYRTVLTNNGAPAQQVSTASPRQSQPAPAAPYNDDDDWI
ncbi:hypothetical protein [Mycobacteroides abscessus]|uniref:hypothetical protein n=1 Tax=Mycobacteroides abscessus TaxID=36809 RepID=UPI00266EEC32|nr:hypothetical protein [Mycobacteroides abscessus]MDO3110483.1 hypothetical protein [Mycobacteroides abscessus subsp. abscessus]